MSESIHLSIEGSQYLISQKAINFMQKNKIIDTNRTLAIQMKTILYCLFGIMFFFATAATMTGILIPEMMESYHLSNSQIGLIGSFQSIGSFSAMMFGGALADRFPKLKLIAIIFAVYTAVMYCIGMAPIYHLLLFYFILLGATNAYLNLLISAFVSEAYGERRTAYMNIMHAFFSIGSLAGPIYGVLAQYAGFVWNQSFIHIGILCTMIVGLFILVISKAEVIQSAPSEYSIKKLLSNIATLLLNRHLQLLALLCAFYMGYQQSISLWITTYVQKGLGLGDEIGNFALVLFWTGIVVARFIQPVIDKRIPYQKYLCAACFVTAIIYMVVLLIGNGLFIIIALFMGGVFTGAAYPTIIAMACALYPNMTGTATATISLVQSISTTLLSWILGIFMEHIGYKAGIMLIPVLVFLCTLILTVLIRHTAKT